MINQTFFPRYVLAACLDSEGIARYDVCDTLIGRALDYDLDRADAVAKVDSMNAQEEGS